MGHDIMDVVVEVVIDAVIVLGGFIVINMPVAIKEVRDGARACGEATKVVEAPRQP